MIEPSGVKVAFSEVSLNSEGQMLRLLLATHAKIQGTA